MPPATYKPRKDYTVAGLIRALKSPAAADGYEVEVARMVAGDEGDGEIYAPLHAQSGTLALPTRAFVRALTTGEATAGGNLVVATLAEVAEASRPRTVLDRLNVPRLELPRSGPRSFPVWNTTSISGGWSGEGADGTEHEPTVRAVNSNPKIATSWVDISRQLMSNTADVDVQVWRELGNATAAVIEKGFIAGTGTEHQPHGLATHIPYTPKTFAAASPTYAELVDMVRLFVDNGGDISRAAWLASSTLASGLMTTERAAGTAQFLAEFKGGAGLQIIGIRAEVSGYMPAGKLLLFDPSEALQVFWGPAFMQANPYIDLAGSTRLLISNHTDFIVKRPAQVIVGAAA